MLPPAFRRLCARCGRGSGRGSFATTAFTLKASGPAAPEQTLFVVGLNGGKFFGQDGSEECLKLLERVADHQPDYHLLFGLNAKEFSRLEEDYQVKGGRLTPSRELTTVEDGEVVPILQAGKVDKRPCSALGRSVKTTQGHVAWRLWRNPREVMRLYWVFWRRKNYKDAARFKFWSQNVPLTSHVYFGESSELIAIRTVEHLISQRREGKGGSTILTVRNDVFASVAERCGHYLGDEETVAQLADPAFSEVLKDHAAALVKDVPDMTPLLVLIYLGFPLLFLHQVALFCEYLLSRDSAPDRKSGGAEFDLVTANRD